MTGFEVLDSMVKIGLGALISAGAAYVMHRQNQQHERTKETVLHQRQLAARKKVLYLDFLTTSHVLVQQYRDTQCRADGEDYFAYLRLYHEVEIIANDPLRVCALKLLNAVNQFIVFHKVDRQPDERELFKAMRAQVDAALGEFQFLAKQEIDAQEA